MAFHPNDKLICYICDMVIGYFEQMKEVPITYLAHECIIAIAYEDIEWAKKEIDMIPQNNIDSQCLYLDKMRNLPVDMEIFNSIISRTSMFKCPYKLNYRKYTIKHQLTYWGKLIQSNSNYEI